MTTNRSKRPIFKLEVTSRDISLRALRPTRRKVVLAILALAVLVGGACAVYFFRGRKVGEVSAKAQADFLKIKEAEKRGDGAAIKKEILERLKKERK